MAEAIVSTVADQLINIIREQVQNEIRLVIGVDDEVLHLADELKTLRNVLDDSENRRFQDKNINHWLSRLEHTSYEMEDVLDEWNYAIQKFKIEHNADDDDAAKQKVCSFSCLCFNKVVVRHDIAMKIQNLREQLDQILKEKDRYNFVTSMPNTDIVPKFCRVQSTSLIDSAKVHGRDRDVDMLVCKLMANGGSQDESSIPILSIVGMGGLGKTTLAQLVYNHSQVEKSFDLRVWICVSDPFDLVAIAKGILESIIGSSLNTIQLDVLLKYVKESISGKKILFVFDDVWTEDYNKWEPLQNSLRYSGAGSKILVTTRNELVVKMMGSRDSDICHPSPLSDDDCWLLLCRIALSGRSEAEFEKIGKEIVKKCDGLPIAVKTLGSLLRFKRTSDEWENILNSEIWKMEKAELEIFPHLLLSYNELSPTLKRCFSYCAVFPKDTEIDVERLIGSWMALGYLGSNVGEMELKGRECFDALAMRFLFQDFQIIGTSEKISSCKMHDIVHDFAQFIRRSGRVEGGRMNTRNCQACDPLHVSSVNEFRSLFWHDNDSPLTICDCLTRVRVLIMNNWSLRSTPKGMEKLIHLSWLDVSGHMVTQENLKIIFQLFHLQTLRLCACSIDKIPREIRNLVHLRHLDLSLNRFLKELPDSICGLHKLRTLDIWFCEKLSRIPEGLARLTGLRRLSEFRGGSGRNKLGILKNLNRLTGHLELDIRLGEENLEEMVEDAWEAKLKNKMELQRLGLLLVDEMDEKEECNKARMDVMDAIEPPSNLHTLTVWGYKGCRLPLSWKVAPLTQLRIIVFADCQHLSSMPPLGKLPLLEQIEIIGMEDLEFVGREFLGMDESNPITDVFPKLKNLTLRDCPKWKKWEDITTEEEKHSNIMPCLTHLIISNCSSLAALPRSLLSKAWPLDNLYITNSEELQQHCRDNDVVFLERYQ